MEDKFKASKKLKNKLYLDFLNGYFVEKITDKDIEIALNNIDKKSKHKLEAKALLVLLYYTGARPAEILELKRQDIIRNGSKLYIHLRTLKRGKPRQLGIPLSKIFAKHIYNYIKLIYPTLYLFNNFRCSYTRKYINKKGNLKEINEVSAKLRYHFKKWFKEIDLTPYFLRHNRFNIMMDKGFSIEAVKEAKGATTVSSVDPYIRFSKRSADKFGRGL